MYKVIVPILNPNMAEDMVRLATALAGMSSKEKPERVKIVVLGVVIVPEETPLSQGASLVKAYRTMLRYIPPETNEHVEVRTEVRVAREVWQGIVEQVHEDDANLLLLHWKGNTQTPGAIYGSTIDVLMKDPPCDMVLARFSNLPHIKSVLIPVRGSGYSSLTLRFAANLCEKWKINATVLHSLVQLPAPVSEYETSSTGSEQSLESSRGSFGPAFTDTYGGPEEGFNALPNLLSDFPPGARLVTLHGDPTTSIVREAAFHDLIMMGASAPDGQLRGENESLVLRIARQVTRPLLVVKTHRPLEIGKTSAPRADDERLAETVDRWFAQNTFHYREFRTMSSLTLLKERNNLSISLVFPVYGKVQPVALADMIRRARYALMRDCALVDEIVISAPGAQFDPDEINLFGVEENGEEVIYIANESPTPSESGTGPGEALWHALRQVRGDIVVWADCSVAGFEARHIYGLVGPLLTYPKFMLASGFFSEEEEHESRPVFSDLNELTIRPLLGGFFPSLAGIIDPVSPIGAARREHLERLPFFTGSAFQSGLLVDTLSRTGLMSVVQIDLGQPQQSICHTSPQRTCSEVMAMILRRLEDRSQSHMASFYNPSVKTISKVDGVYSLKVTPPATPSREFPPPLYTPGYHRRQF